MDTNTAEDSRPALTIQDLIRFGTITPECAEFLHGCVLARQTIVVTGGTSSGKTTFLNVLSSFVPRDEHVVNLEQGLGDAPGRGRESPYTLVENAARMRPDRIVAGDLRGDEALPFLQALGSGCRGSMAAVSSILGARDALERLERMCLMAGTDMVPGDIRQRIASTIDWVVCLERMRDGTRRVMRVTEVRGMEGDRLTLSDIFEFENTWVHQGKVPGRLLPTGMRPMRIDPILDVVPLHASIFGFRTPRKSFGDSTEIASWYTAAQHKREAVTHVMAVGTNLVRRFDVAFPRYVSVGDTVPLRISVLPPGAPSVLRDVKSAGDRHGEALARPFPTDPATGWSQKIVLDLRVWVMRGNIVPIGAHKPKVGWHKSDLMVVLDPEGSVTTAEVPLKAVAEGEDSVSVQFRWGGESFVSVEYRWGGSHFGVSLATEVVSQVTGRLHPHADLSLESFYVVFGLGAA